MPTFFIRTMARLRASISETFWCFIMTEVICFPMVIIGFRLVIGSWNMVAIFCPRIFVQSLTQSVRARLSTSEPCSLPFSSSKYFTRKTAFSNIPLSCSSSEKSTPMVMASLNAR